MVRAIRKCRWDLCACSTGSDSVCGRVYEVLAQWNGLKNCRFAIAGWKIDKNIFTFQCWSYSFRLQILKILQFQPSSRIFNAFWYDVFFEFSASHVRFSSEQRWSINQGLIHAYSWFLSNSLLWLVHRIRGCGLAGFLVKLFCISLSTDLVADV